MRPRRLRKKERYGREEPARPARKRSRTHGKPLRREPAQGRESAPRERKRERPGQQEDPHVQARAARAQAPAAVEGGGGRSARCVQPRRPERATQLRLAEEGSERHAQDHPAGRSRRHRQEHDGVRVQRRHDPRRRRPDVSRRQPSGRRSHPARLHLRAGERRQAARHRHHARPRGPHGNPPVPHEGPRSQRAHLRHEDDAGPHRGQVRRA